MADETKPADPTSMFSDTQKGLAWFITGSFVLLIFLWVFFPPTMAPESMAQLNNLVTTLVTLVVMAFGYFLGSSRQSKDKDTASAKITETLAEKVGGTGNGTTEAGAMKAAVAAAAMAAPAAAAVAAPAAAAIAAPPAAAVAAPPVVNEVVPPAVEKAVADAMAAHDELEKQK